MRLRLLVILQGVAVINFSVPTLKVGMLGYHFVTCLTVLDDLKALKCIFALIYVPGSLHLYQLFPLSSLVAIPKT